MPSLLCIRCRANCHTTVVVVTGSTYFDITLGDSLRQ
jgi:hypothetical protein